LIYIIFHMPKKETNLAKKILSWYDNNYRRLPWRIGKNFQRIQYYRILSEFMLQQTQVKTVLPYFARFIKKIPNLKILSKSKEKRILKLWEGLGYYRRAKNLHKTSKILVKFYNSKLPKNIKEMKRLPGIGEYTANALLALVYNKPNIPIDGNVSRVLNRLFNKDIKIVDNEIKKRFKTKRNSDLAEALMEFGAIICKPKNPLCNICKLKKECKFFNKEITLSKKKSLLFKKQNYNIFCYLNNKKEIALTRNKNLSFLNNFKIPKTRINFEEKNSKIKGWIHLCNYKNNISNIKMDINLFYKFTDQKPKQFKWHSINRPTNEFVPSFTKKIFKKVSILYK